MQEDANQQPILRWLCPVLRHFRSDHDWSFMQVECATDVVFRRQAGFQPLYEKIARTAEHVIKAEHVALFLGRKLTNAYRGEIGNDFSTRIQGTRIRHHIGPASIRLYDKFALIALIERNADDASFFMHHRWVEQRNGEVQFKLVSLRKNLYGLRDVRQFMQAANDRYLAFMACLDNSNAGQKAIAKMAAPAKAKGHSFPNFTTCFSTSTHASFSPSSVANGRSPASAPPICAPTSQGSQPGASPASSNACAPKA